MKCKRTIAMLLSLMMVLGVLSGCGDTQDTSNNGNPSAQPLGMVSVEDPAVLQPKDSILTTELLEAAAQNPLVTAEDHPRWTGFALGYYDNLGEPGTTPETIELCAEWGFNSARVMLPYTTLFDQDVTSANLDMFYQLDEMVAAAIENDIHLNIVLKAVPGRVVHEGDETTEYVSTGDFDLFLNEEKQELALTVYRTLASRYKEVSNYNLSITPFWEALNKNLSTGLPYEDYTPEDVAAFLGKAIDAIRAEDPDRLIIYEPTATNHELDIIQESARIKEVADDRENAIISYNFCQNAYVYACMTMAEGAHIDNMNNSMYIPNYPATVYSVATGICVGDPLTLDGFLPAGTVIDVYLERSGVDNTLDISADGVSLYRESIPQAEYDISERLSIYYPFATSEKKVSVTLAQDTKEVIISCLKDGGFDFSGIQISLPEEYGVERWYYSQAYDVYMGNEEEQGVVLRKSSDILLGPNDHGSGRHITIHEDLTYTSENIYEEASPETIAAWSEAISEFDGNCAIRFERADFSGGVWSEMKEYYEALLKSFEEYGYSWWSNDWWLMTEEFPQTKIIAECPSTEYAGYEYFNLEMLELFQKYQSKE